MITKDQFISAYPMLNESELINNIIEFGRIKSLPYDEILIDLDQKITHFPLIIKGSIKIIREDENGHEIFLYYVEAGNTCAATISCCIEGKRSTIRAIVEEDAEFISIPIEYMDLWIEKYKSWRNYIFQSFSNRFNDMLNAVDQLAFKKMDERILAYLNETSNLTQSKTIHVSHQEIAMDLNTSREVVSRILKQLERNKSVKLKRGRIELV